MSGALLGLTALYYIKTPRKSLAFAFGGGIFFSAMNLAALFPRAPSAVIAALEAAALLSWLMSAASFTGGQRARFSVRASAVCFLAILASLLFMAPAGFSSPNHVVVISLLEIAIILFAVYHFTTPYISGFHYVFQAFLFIGLAAGMTGTSFFMNSEAIRLDVAIQLARSFGVFSMLLFLSSSASSAAASAAIKSDPAIRDAYFTASHAFRQIDDIPGSLDRKEILSRGMSLIASALREIQGFNFIFHGKIEGDSDPVLKDCLSGTGNGMVSTQIRLPANVIDEIKERPVPILISDIAKDERFNDRSFERHGMKSIAVIPLNNAGNPERILVLGSAPGTEHTLLPDIDAVEMISSFISIVYSHLLLRCEMAVMPDVDATTLLKNFSSFNKLLSASLDDSDRNGATLALVFIDVDHFSAVNEKCGFERGDLLLRELGAELSVFADADSIGRIGADEFAIIIPNAQEDVRESLENMLKSVNARMKEISGDIAVTVSAAYSIYPFDFFDRTGVFSRMREMLSVGRTASSWLVRVKVG
ncbi:MAG TPA: sensor domain-containing diguanylate cyclase [bacterium]|nr:sensor domain-containing diguanylate cyclase [bacterium]